MIWRKNSWCPLEHPTGNGCLPAFVCNIKSEAQWRGISFWEYGFSKYGMYLLPAASAMKKPGTPIDLTFREWLHPPCCSCTFRLERIRNPLSWFQWVFWHFWCQAAPINYVIHDEKAGLPWIGEARYFIIGRENTPVLRLPHRMKRTPFAKG